MSETAIVRQESTKASVPVGTRGIQINDLDGLYRFAKAVSASGLAPKGIETPEAILVAVQMGLEVGLTPMAALQNIAVINGRPSVWGDSQLAIVRATGELEEFEEWYESGGKHIARNPLTYTDDTTAVCRVQRRGYPSAEFGFSVSDAKRAGLWDKAGPWKQYPARMLKFRARSFLLRDHFGDALKGLLSAEEVSDSTESRFQAAKQATASRSNVTMLHQPAEVPPVTEATPEAAAPEAPSPQFLLMDLVKENGFSFAELNEWGVQSGNLEQPLASPDDLATATAAKWLKAKAGLLKGLADLRKAAQ